MPYLSKGLVPQHLVDADEVLRRTLPRAEKGDPDAMIAIIKRLRDTHGIKRMPWDREST